VPGAMRFLYGLVMGVSVGIIVSKLLAASASGAHRPARRVTPVRVEDERQEAEEAATR
jgi:hypothetical protein